MYMYTHWYQVHFRASLQKIHLLRSFSDQASYNQCIESWHGKGIIPRQSDDVLRGSLPPWVKVSLRAWSKKHTSVLTSYTPVITNLMCFYHCFPFLLGNLKTSMWTNPLLLTLHKLNGAITWRVAKLRFAGLVGANKTKQRSGLWSGGLVIHDHFYSTTYLPTLDFDPLLYNFLCRLHLQVLTLLELFHIPRKVLPTQTLGLEKNKIILPFTIPHPVLGGQKKQINCNCKIWTKKHGQPPKHPPLHHHHQKKQATVTWPTPSHHTHTQPPKKRVNFSY